MSKLVKTINIPSNTDLNLEDSITASVTPLLKQALFPGSSVLPARNVVLIIEVLETL